MVGQTKRVAYDGRSGSGRLTEYIIDCGTMTNPPGMQPWSHDRPTPDGTKLKHSLKSGRYCGVACRSCELLAIIAHGSLPVNRTISSEVCRVLTCSHRFCLVYFAQTLTPLRQWGKAMSQIVENPVVS